MVWLKSSFNKAESTFVHLDINSCFATLEQQANPLFRNKPLVVTAYSGRKGCVLASSKEAKKLGIKTGMRLEVAQKIYPNLISIVSDPNKYRFIHLQIKSLLLEYTPSVNPKSIDEFVLDFSTFNSKEISNLKQTCQTIKNRIKSEIGDYVTVSVGLGPSAFLAKTASNLKKPDGLEEINFQNFLDVYSKLELTDLTGINTKTATRLNIVGIYTVLDLYYADITLLKKAFHSILASYWYQKIRGYDAGVWTDSVKSIGHTYTLPKASATVGETKLVLAKLAEKVSVRLRHQGFVAHGLSLGVRFQNQTSCHKSLTVQESLFDSSTIYCLAEKVLDIFPRLPVRNIYLTCFNLTVSSSLQLDLWGQTTKKADLNQCLDTIKEKWGNYAIHPASILGSQNHAPDAIGFGNIP